MAVQQEIKSQLAKLLATEDLVVEHKNVPTAQFNVHTRELLLPLWEKASSTVYDMLVGHEVGHALFTPDEEMGVEVFECSRRCKNREVDEKKVSWYCQNFL